MISHALPPDRRSQSAAQEEGVPRSLSVIVAALLAVQALLGLLFPGEYRDLEWIRAAWFGNDWITLVIGAPALLLSVALARRGSTRGVLLWVGLLGYAVYNYAFYMLGASLNVFFPLYVLAFVLAGIGMIQVLTRTEASAIAQGFHPRTPVRLLGSYFLFLATGLTLVWIGQWAAHVFAGRPTPVEPEAFRLIAALDLSLMVPALGAGGVLLWRRRAWGFVIASIAGVQAALYLVVLAVGSAVAIHRGLADAPGELPIWGTLAATTIAATVALLLCAQGPSRFFTREPEGRCGGTGSRVHSITGTR